MEHTFTLTEQDGHTLLTSQEYPWCVLQVVPTTPDTYLRTYSLLLNRGYIAHHPVCRQFLIIHLASGNHDGQHPEREIKITQSNSLSFLSVLKDTMAQAVEWYYTHIIDKKKND